MEKILCEQATGCSQHGNIGKFYDNTGCEISIKYARKIFRQGNTVEVPNAGAGSFREVFKMLGYKKVDVYEWSSSAGDWTFILRGKGYACQENRYPYHGFRYGLCEIYQ